MSNFNCPNCNQTLQEYYREARPRGRFWRVVDNRADEAWRVINNPKSSNKAIYAAKEYLESA